jgi:sporulation protein YlmC with PRC-barrel domain
VRLSSCQRWRVVTQDGQALGRVFDFRCTGAPVGRKPTAAAEVRVLVYGSVGWLERLGVRTARECEVRWDDVIAVRGRDVVVRDAVAQRR